MRDLIKKILKESEDDLGWAEDIVGNTDVYQLRDQDFIRFMNQYFQTHPSPTLNRTYQIVSTNVGYYSLADHTGYYVEFHNLNLHMKWMVREIERVLDKYRKASQHEMVYKEFLDLYNTIKPLIDSIST